MLFTNKVYYKEFFQKYGDKLVIVNGVNINESGLKIIETNIDHAKLLFLTEPIKNVCDGDYKNSFDMLQNKQFDIVIGCINHDPSNNLYKFPLYLFENKFDIYNKHQFAEVNSYVSRVSVNDILSKKFCVLINSWDKGVRTCIYKRLNDLGQIYCPGKLFNNCSNSVLNSVGKKKYISHFLFNICSENFDNNNVDGYITEKLMDCCLGSAIPIYAGWFDEYDSKIFNKNRILFYNSNSLESQINLRKRIEHLLNNKEDLLAFYSQPVFCDTAYATICSLKNDFDNKMNALS
jgi:hypothetical protein